MATWKPTSEEKRIIRQCAVRSAHLRRVKIEPGERYRLNAWVTDPTSINILLLSDDPDWNDTDLHQTVPWTEFTKGVELTADGRALVDFYVYGIGEFGELETNVQACYENGALQWVEGTGDGRLYVRK